MGMLPMEASDEAPSQYPRASPTYRGCCCRATLQMRPGALIHRDHRVTLQARPEALTHRDCRVTLQGRPRIPTQTVG